MNKPAHSERVPFFKWLYHTTFHRAVHYEPEGEGKERRFCSCGLSWRENV